MEKELKTKINSKKVEVLEKFIELSELYRLDPDCNNKFDYDAINQLLELAKVPDTDTQNDIFGLISGAIDVAVKYRIYGEKPKID